MDIIYEDMTDMNIPLYSDLIMGIYNQWIYICIVIWYIYIYIVIWYWEYQSWEYIVGLLMYGDMGYIYIYWFNTDIIGLLMDIRGHTNRYYLGSHIGLLDMRYQILIY